MKTLFSRMQVGDRFSARWSDTLSSIGRNNKSLYKDWKIKEIYPYHVLAVSDSGLRECFTYGEFVQMGLEPQKPFDKKINYDRYTDILNKEVTMCE